MDTVADRLSSRKLWFCVFGVTLSTYLRIHNHIDVPSFVSLCNLFGGGYLAANLSQKAIDALVEKLTGKTVS
jgi:hypothetical protein